MHSCWTFMYPHSLYGSFHSPVPLLTLTPCSYTPQGGTAPSDKFHSNSLIGEAQCWCYSNLFLALPSHHTMIGWTWRCTWRLLSSEFRDAPEAGIVWTQRYTRSLYLKEFGTALWCHDHENWEAVIERVWRCTWRPWSIEIEWLPGYGGSRSGRSGGRHDGSWDSNYWLTCNCGNVESWVLHGLLKDER